MFSGFGQSHLGEGVLLTPRHARRQDGVLVLGQDGVAGARGAARPRHAVRLAATQIEQAIIEPG